MGVSISDQPVSCRRKSDTPRHDTLLAAPSSSCCHAYLMSAVPPMTPPNHQRSQSCSSGKKKRTKSRSSSSGSKSGTSSSGKKRKSKRRSSTQAGSLLSMNNVSHAIATHVTRSTRKTSPIKEYKSCSLGGIHQAMSNIVGVGHCVLENRTVVSVASARQVNDFIEYHVILQQNKEVSFSRWFRYSAIRKAALLCPCADMATFPPKTSIFTSSKNPTIVRERKAALSAWITLMVTEQKGALAWLIDLLS